VGLALRNSSPLIHYSWNSRQMQYYGACWYAYSTPRRLDRTFCLRDERKIKDILADTQSYQTEVVEGRH